MSVTPEPGLLGPHMTLFGHALRLHREHPDGPFERDGEPFPDQERYHARRQHRDPGDRRRDGIDVAAVLDRHFSRPDAPARELAYDFLDIDVPIHHNEHITAAALRAHPVRVRRTGRWLVRHSVDRNAATVGLALLATGADDADIPMIQTIGLLSEQFGPLAAEALRRRRGGAEALRWLAERVTGWGRVYVIEALSGSGTPSSRAWLLRNACDGDVLNGYFAGRVATRAHLHEAIAGGETDDALIDHTGRLLSTMAYCRGMGLDLENYPHAPAVLAAHAAHLARQAPAVQRFVDAATLADHLTRTLCGCTAEQRDRIVRQYLDVLDRPAWGDTVRAGLDPTSDFFDWFTESVATRLRLSAFSDVIGADVTEGDD